MESPKVPSVSFSSSPLFKSNYPAQNSPKLTVATQESFKDSSFDESFKKFSNLYENIPPDLTHENISLLHQDWEAINRLLQSYGLKEIELDGSSAKSESINERFAQLIHEYSIKCVELNKSEELVIQLECENQKAIEKIKELENRIADSKSRFGFEEEVRELEKMSREMESKFRRLKEKLKQKDEKIRYLESLQQASPNLKSAFEAHIDREFRSKSKTDPKILSILSLSDSLKLLLNALSCSTVEEALKSISQLKYSTPTNISQEFIKDLSGLLYCKSSRSDLTELFPEMLQKLAELKKNLNYLQEFRESIFVSLNCQQTLNNSEFLLKLQTFSHFRRLFSLEDSGDERKAVENLFLFVYQIKIFLQHARSIIHGEDLSLIDLLNELSSRLKSIYS